jgi:ADP-ribose pyrophosphatase
VTAVALEIPPYPGLSVESCETVWQGRIPLQVVRFRHRRFDGSISGLRTWELWRRGPAVAMLPYDPVADMLVVIEQFRLPALVAGVDPVLVEIPAGFLDAGEDPQTAITREMHEETGLQADRLVPIGRFVLTAGGSDETCTIFAGRIRAPQGDTDARFGLAAEQEDIRLRLLPATQAIETALAGGYPNSVTTIAMLWFAARRDRLREEWGTT